MELLAGQTGADGAWARWFSECTPELVPGTGSTGAASAHSSISTLPAWVPHPSAGFLEEKAVLQTAAL